MNGRTSFLFFGDLFLGGAYTPFARRHEQDFLFPFHALKQRMSSTDVLLANLEGPILEDDHASSQRAGATSLLANRDEVVDFLSGWNTCVCNLANNHIMDYGTEGLARTVSTLESRAVHHVGAGQNEAEAKKACVLNAGGRSIGFLSYTTDEPHVGSVIATENQPGCASLADRQEIFCSVAKLRERVDVVVVSLHWGHEYFKYPDAEQVRFARALVDHGARFVIGHHPHVVQGVERYKEGLIVYSLGNFFLPAVRMTSGRVQLRSAASREFMLVEAEIDELDHISFKLVGGKMSKGYDLKIYGPGEQAGFRDRVCTLSEGLDRPDYAAFWEKYQQQRERAMHAELLLAAFRKLTQTPFSDIRRTLTIDDLKRNMTRLYRMISR